MEPRLECGAVVAEDLYYRALLLLPGATGKYSKRCAHSAGPAKKQKMAKWFGTLTHVCSNLENKGVIFDPKMTILVPQTSFFDAIFESGGPLGVQCQN